MINRSWIRTLFTRAPRTIRKVPARFRPRLEVLEDRLTPSGTVYTVNTLGDESSDPHTATTGDLRYCLSQATSGSDTIQFDASLTSGGPATVTLNSDLPNIAHSVTINGPGANLLAIYGGGTYKIFEINSKVSVRISGLAIEGGLGPVFQDAYGSYHAGGGGIFNDGTVTLTNCTLDSNGSGGIPGGAIYNNNDGTATLTNCTLTNNNGDQGGAIDNAGGMITLTNCTLSGNNGYSGAGVENNGTATLTDCNISDNYEGTDGYSFGAGIDNGGTVTLTNCTISGNEAALCGGINNTGTATLTNCTVTGNIADDSGRKSFDVTFGFPYTPSTDLGGGIATSQGASTTLTNTIVANNLKAKDLKVNDYLPSDLYLDSGKGSSYHGSYDLIGDGSHSSSFSHVLTGDPLLAPLAKYGGPTQTMALLPGSSAIDAGTSTGAPSQDQRGQGRVGAVDIGAFESQGFTMSPVSGDNQVATVNSAFSNPLVVQVVANNSAEPVAGGIVTITAPASGASGVFGNANATITGTTDASGQVSEAFTANTHAGSYTVTTSAAGVGTPASFSLTNIADAATYFTVSTPPNATAGSPFNFTVTAWDQFNNIATGYTGTVHITKSDSGAGSSVPGNYTFVAGDNGVKTFTNGATLVTAGNQTLTATDSNTSSITGTSNSISVAPAAATLFLVSAPSGATEGSAFNFTVTAKDQFNNTATGYSGTVHFTGGVGPTSLPADSTLTQGTGSFSATLEEEGSQTISATDMVQSSITGTSNNIAVADAALTAGALTPPSAAMGVPFSGTIFHSTDANPNATASDFSAVVTLGDGNTVTLTSAPGTNGQIVANGGGFDVQLSYTYTTAFAGQTFAVNVTDVGGAPPIGASINNFAIGFVDDFGVNGPLSSAWTVQVGDFQVNSGLAHGTAPLDIATVNNFTAPNTAVQADVNVSGLGQYAGLVSHYSGSHDDTNMFWAGLINWQGQIWAQIWVNLGGTWGNWSNQYVGSAASGTLRLETVGSSLKLFYNNNLVGYANDTRLTGGTVGLRASAGATIGHFRADVLALTNNTLAFGENFNTATNQQLSNSWLNQQGNFTVANGVATGSVNDLVPPYASLDVATVNGLNNTDVFVQADVNVAASQTGGLVARYSGPLDQNMDWAGLVNLGGGMIQAQIWQNYHGVWSELFFQNYSSNGTGTLRFEAVGSSLKLFLNNSLLAWANDTLLTGGTVGMRSTAGVTFDKFSADVLTLNNQPLGLGDNFNAATNQQLSNRWLNQAGNFQVAGGVATGLFSPLGVDVATVNGLSVLNSTVQATVTVNPGQTAGLVSRYSGPGDSNMYWACVEGIGSDQAAAMIFVNRNGIWSQLPVTATVSFAGGTGTLKLVTFGNSLTLYVNGVSTLSINDDSLLSAGTVGIRATQGAIIDNFSASSP